MKFGAWDFYFELSEKLNFLLFQTNTKFSYASIDKKVWNMYNFSQIS
jgi:hypothetical protein